MVWFVFVVVIVVLRFVFFLVKFLNSKYKVNILDMLVGLCFKLVLFFYKI